MSISATTRGLRPGVCTSTTRPASPFDGQLIYETDSNLLLVWNGSAWKTLSYSDATNGTVLQVVSTSKTDTFSTTSTSFTDVTGMSVSITPTSTSSKVLVLLDAKIGGIGFLKMLRGSTDIYVGDASSSRIRTMAFAVPNSNGYDPSGGIFLDSPNTTSSVTYKIQIRGEAGANVRINRSENDPDNTTSAGRAASSITVMEVAA